MFDFSWMELAFVAALALVIIGPKDLPKVFHMGGKMIAKAKRTVNDLKGSITQLQREVDIDAGKINASSDWQSFLPEEVKHLPDDFVPGSLPAQHHQNRKTHIEKAQADFANIKEESEGRT